MAAPATMESTKPKRTAEPEDKPALELVCNEVWGGNRTFDGPFELPGVRGVLYSRPCEGARGGDVHYLSTCGSGVITRLCVADVVGHGEKVARVSSVMHAYLKRSINQLDQRRVLRGLNQRLTKEGVDTMTTLAALTYLPPTGTLRVSYAGHEPGWLFRRSEGRWERLRLGEQDGLYNIAMAVERRSRYSQRKIRVETGDRVLLVTDGVLETPDPEGRLFGAERVGTILAAHTADDCATIRDALLAALRRHAGREDLAHDDVTFLLAEFTPNMGRSVVWRMLRNRILRPKGNTHLPAFADSGPAALAGGSQPA